MSFHLFTSFPPEIQGLIVEACPPNDQICLRLTCKSLYYTPVPKTAISLETTDLGTSSLCGKTTSSDWTSRWTHRQKCHKLSYDAICARNKQLGKPTPEMKKKCRTRWSSHHCECFTRRMRLHLRLKSWMPRGLNYCGTCAKFTKRKRSHNGRCYHGQPKERKSGNHFWTHTSRGGAFGRKIWKKWFNNRAMNKLEARLASERQAVQRNGSQRYSLRRLEPMDVDTTEVRDSKSSSYRW
ncbi:hypothetical protein DL95DRAFT_450980 [Leptodontidium sp. 2 PMI_412]|nr:hypothetical protein BKA61DRAFT_642310 [Leptodontidium sp. MPI-SDFR-AT-0119]KAH9206038.1 hypothetical protein DL95DRAFT_450980 [Leptodontidium sp. 2 PMI_412]